MKKHNILMVIIMVVVVGLFLIACGDDGNNNNSSDLAVGLNSVTNDDMYTILHDDASGSIFVYVGLSTCPHCHNFEPVLTETLTELDKGLRHFEADTARALDDESQMTMAEILTIMIEHTDNEWRGQVPAMLHLIDGEVVDFMLGNVSAERIVDFFERNGALD